MAKAKRVSRIASASGKTGKRTFCVCCPDWEIKNPERCGNTIKKRDGTLYFCTKRCKERYEKSPERFTLKA